MMAYNKKLVCKVIFWIELNCLHKSYTNKSTLLLRCTHCYKNSTVVLTIWLTLTKNPFLKWQWALPLLRRLSFTVITDKTFTGHDYKRHSRYLIRNRNCLPFASSWAHPWYPCNSSLKFSMMCILFCLSCFFVLCLMT